MTKSTYKEQVQQQLTLIKQREEQRRKKAEAEAKRNSRYISFEDAAAIFLAEQEEKRAQKEAADELAAKQAKHDSRVDRTYRIVLFDRNNILPKREEYVTAKSKEAAILILQSVYAQRAKEEHDNICAGKQKRAAMVVLPTGVVSRGFVQSISAEYYQHFCATTWGIADVFEDDGVISRTISSSVTVESTAKKAQKTERRDNWSKKAKKEAARARALAKKRDEQILTLVA